MNNITKKTGLARISIVGATAAAATVLVAGFASPAMAATGYDSSIHASSGTNSVSAASALTQAQFDALRSLPTGLSSNLSNPASLLLSPGISSVPGVSSLPGISSLAAASGDISSSVPDVSAVTGNPITSEVQKLGAKAQTTGSSAASKLTSTTTSAKAVLGEIVGSLGLGTN